MPGNLYIVATPIGNLEDVSRRCLQVLSEVEAILCEDTRITKRLLDRYQIKKPLYSFHQHSGKIKVERFVQWIKEGKDLALTSDAGTPGISDPGGILVAALRSEFPNDSNIIPIPGPCAAIAALSASGWPADKFLFFGFLPHKKGRQKQLKEILTKNYPVVLYESKHRLAKLLQELSDLESSQGRQLELILAREITKKFERFYFGRPAELLDRLTADPQMSKGEFVVILRSLDK